MENQAAKTREKYDDDDDVGSGSDRISRLPDPVLHHILCFLSQKKAVQTSVLSKSWRHLGPTRPVIDLRRNCCWYHSLVFPIKVACENCFFGNKEEFVPVLEKTFQRYHEHNLFTQELRLQMLRVDSQTISVLEKWIPIMLVKPNTLLTTLHLSLGSWGVVFDLPSILFRVESLQKLYLEGINCSLKGINSIDSVIELKNLQRLSLRRVRVGGEALEKILLGCPLVEYVTLVDCEGLDSFSVNGNENQFLKSFEFCWCHPKETDIEIDVSTLQSIHIDRCSKLKLDHVNYFPHLKSLYLSQVKVSTESGSSDNFPRLEELTLLDCSGFEEIKLSSRSIKRLTIQPSVLLKKVSIDAPNIIYFDFLGCHVQRKSSLGEGKSHLDFSRCEDAFELLEIVKTLNRSRISLSISETLLSKIKKIEWGFSDQSVVVEQGLALNIIKFCPDSLPDLLHDLFRIFRPRYINALSVYGHDGKERVAEFLWKILIHERGKIKYGWEQHLEEVSFEVCDEKGKVLHHVEWECMHEWSNNKKIRFPLKWRH